MTFAEHVTAIRKRQSDAYAKLPPIAPVYAEDCDTLDPYGVRDEYAGSYGSWPIAYRGVL